MYLLVFHAYINKMQGSRSKIPSKKLVKQRCADVFNFGVKVLKNDQREIRKWNRTNQLITFTVPTEYHCYFPSSVNT
jgi:hypothetical protein